MGCLSSVSPIFGFKRQYLATHRISLDHFKIPIFAQGVKDIYSRDFAEPIAPSDRRAKKLRLRRGCAEIADLQRQHSSGANEPNASNITPLFFSSTKVQRQRAIGYPGPCSFLASVNDHLLLAIEIAVFAYGAPESGGITLLVGAIY